MADVTALMCVLGLVVVLGGGVLVMLYGVSGLTTMVRSWVDRK